MGGAGIRTLQRQDSLWDKLNENLPIGFEDFNRREADAQIDANHTEEPKTVAPLQEYAVGTQATGASPGTRPIVQRLIYNQLSPEQTLLRDKIGFVAGISNIALTAWWMAKWPDTFYWWYTAKSLLMYGLRFVIYRTKRQHYFMLEMCYSVNLVLLAYLWLFPRSAWLYKATFGLVAGPLTWSIVALRNSLVLHSLDQMTSLFMHASPALVVWALRWHPSSRIFDIASMPQTEASTFQHASFGQLVGGSVALYSVWALAYYLKVFVVSAQRIKERNYETLYTLMTKNKKGMVARIVFSVPKPFQPVIYMLFHFLLSSAAAVTAYLCWHSFYYHTAFVLLMLLGAAWNGSNFYFSHFAFKYVKKTGLDKLDEKKA